MDAAPHGSHLFLFYPGRIVFFIPFCLVVLLTENTVLSKYNLIFY